MIKFCVWTSWLEHCKWLTNWSGMLCCYSNGVRSLIFLLSCFVRSILFPHFQLFLLYRFLHNSQHCDILQAESKHLSFNLKRVCVFLVIQLMLKSNLPPISLWNFSHELLWRNLFFSTKRDFYNNNGLSYIKRPWWNNVIIFNTFCFVIFKITDDTFNKFLWLICC